MTSNNLSNRILRGISANLLGQISNIAIQIFSLPIFLNYWGKELYGEWLILSAIPVYLSMSDTGFSIAAANEMTMEVAQGNKKAALKIFQSMWMLVTSVSFAVAIIIILVISWVPITTWLNISQLTHFQVAFILSLLMIHVLFCMQGNILVAGFRCEGNYALGIFYYNLVRIFEYGVLLITVCLGATPSVTALFFLITRVIFTFIMKIALKNKSPWIKFGFQYANLTTIKYLAKPALAAMSFPLGNALGNQGSLLVIGSLLGSVNVVIFSTLRTLSRLAFQLMGMIRSTIAPEISIAYATKDIKLARKLHHYATQLSILLVLFTVSVLIYKGDWIFKKWTNGIVDINKTLFYTFLLIIIINSLWSNSLAVLTAINQHSKVAIYYLIGNISSLLLSIGLISYFGLNGAGFAFLVTEIIMLFFVIKNSLIILEEKLVDYLYELVNLTRFLQNCLNAIIKFKN